MNCYICGVEAEAAYPYDGGERVTCRDCGVYQITDAVLRELGPRQLSLVGMREDLHRQRQIDAKLVADINTETVIWA
ncbi:hypothetical protein ALP03_00058 [Pseudomonas amygdali pv. tabaci]|uniref:GATA-type domain-containing protein n=1 Tax=Pseudomonas amygdali pv. tabaci TaxID=322 RepID=A0A3M6HY93_PSEAJ|nr:hypothetical protein ALP03_00058 [Pseudomonas amygdali pv. tabaci]